MKGYLITALIVLGISMFVGIIVISIGIGSAITQLNQIAGPMVCHNQRLEIDQHTYSYQPGEESWSITAYCVDSVTGRKKDVTTLVQLASGMIYSLVIFGFALIALIWISFAHRNSGA